MALAQNLMTQDVLVRASHPTNGAAPWLLRIRRNGHGGYEATIQQR